jgi:hypothetical protein
VAWYREYFARAEKGDASAMIDFTQEQIAAYGQASL